jgi:hypothetical protein
LNKSDNGWIVNFENEEFRSFLESGKTPEEWINQRLIVPGLKVANAKMDKTAMIYHEERIRKWLGAQSDKGFDDAHSKELKGLFFSLEDLGLTIKEYAQAVNDRMVKTFNLDTQKAYQFSYVLDEILLQSLSMEQAHAIHSKAFTFAKFRVDLTNEEQFFCCFFNPRTAKVDFGAIEAGHGALHPMDQLGWEPDQNLVW